jgi:5-methylcytosine-specific restriction endonuclease McrA
MPPPSAVNDLRHCNKAPIREIFDAWQTLSQAVDAHLAGDTGRAMALLGEANSPAVCAWTNPTWGRPRLNVRHWHPSNDTRVVPSESRHSLRHPTDAVKQAALTRDGFRCRYCGIPVIHAEIRKLAHRLYPDAVPWGRNLDEQHAAFQCMWLQFDHVVPHSHGGPSTLDNIVVTCALCNYGKDCYTLAQLGLTDPRTRPPEPGVWDGLERLRLTSVPPRLRAVKPSRARPSPGPAALPAAAPVTVEEKPIKAAKPKKIKAPKGPEVEFELKLPAGSYESSEKGRKILVYPSTVKPQLYFFVRDGKWGKQDGIYWLHLTETDVKRRQSIKDLLVEITAKPTPAPVAEPHVAATPAAEAPAQPEATVTAA